MLAVIRCIVGPDAAEKEVHRPRSIREPLDGRQRPVVERIDRIGPDLAMVSDRAEDRIDARRPLAASWRVQIQDGLQLGRRSGRLILRARGLGYSSSSLVNAAEVLNAGQEDTDSVPANGSEFPEDDDDSTASPVIDLSLSKFAIPDLVLQRCGGAGRRRAGPRFGPRQRVRERRGRRRQRHGRCDLGMVIRCVDTATIDSLRSLR